MGHDLATDSRAPVVYVDDRERVARIDALLAGRWGVAVRIKRLASGDYFVGAHVGVERKSAADLHRSVAEGRLFAQMRRLRAAYPVPILLTQARPAASRLPGMHPNAVRGALASVAGRFGVAVLPGRGRCDAARYLALLARQEARAGPANPSRAAARRGALERRRLRVLESLPDVGPVLAHRLLARFGTVEACLAASEESLAGVAGIGSRRARRIRAVVG